MERRFRGAGGPHRITAVDNSDIHKSNYRDLGCSSGEVAHPGCCVQLP